MKLILYIGVFICSFSVAGQEWRDSLDVARTAYKAKEYVKAMKYYESAQKNAPENVDLSDEMAQSSYKAREFEKAEKIYQQNNTSKTSSLKKADNYHNLGNSRMKAKNYQGAIEAYKESLRLNPNDDKTRYNLSEAIRQLKNQQKQDQNKKDKQENQGNQQNKENQGNKGDKGDKEKDGGNSDNQKKGQLPNKTVDRMLDKLMKEEAGTKRKVNGSKGENKTPQSGKDW